MNHNLTSSGICRRTCTIRRSKARFATDGFLDRDTKYTLQFRRLIAESKTAVIRWPSRSPNLNAFAERFVRSIKEECLDQMIFVGQASLHRAVREFAVHYHGERNHQGLGNRLIQPGPTASPPVELVQCRQRLGGILNFYHQSVA